MSDEQFEPSGGYEYGHEGTGDNGRQVAWVRRLIQFCIVTTFVSIFLVGRFPSWSHMAHGVPWFWALFAFWGLLVLLWQGDSGDERAYSKPDQWAHLWANRDTYAEVDDLLEMTACEKPKRIARLGDDGEIVYVEGVEGLQHRQQESER
jgi:hypothetical protein